MNFNQKFRLKKFFGQLEIFQCSFCLNLSNNPVIDRNTKQIVCMKHLHRSQQNNRGILLHYLLYQTKIICQYCYQEKCYQSYHRHRAKCLDRFVNSHYIINFFNFINEPDQVKLTCQQCGKIDLKLCNCSNCKISKCINCKFSDKDCCSKSVILGFVKDNNNIQLQCKAEFCREIVSVQNVLKHYQFCNYRLKQCRTKLCNWEGYKRDYQNHECQQKIDFHSNQTHSIKYSQILDIKEQNRISLLQQKTKMKIQLLNKKLENMNQI